MTDLFTWADFTALSGTRAHVAKVRRELDDELAAIEAEMRASDDPFEQDDLRFALEIVHQQMRTLELTSAQLELA